MHCIEKETITLTSFKWEKLQTSLGCVSCWGFCSTTMHTSLIFLFENNQVIIPILTGLLGQYEKSRPPLMYCHSKLRQYGSVDLNFPVLPYKPVSIGLVICYIKVRQFCDQKFFANLFLRFTSAFCENALKINNRDLCKKTSRKTLVDPRTRYNNTKAQIKKS